MLNDDYIKQIERLRSTFGEKKFPKEMVKTMWWRLKGYSDHIFSNAVDSLICEAKFPPKLSEIIDHCNQAKNKIPRPVTELGYCLECRGMGVIFAKHKVNRCEFSFRCPGCHPPEFSAIPEWRKELLKDFDVMEMNY